jgi:hypothetical protein
MSWATGLTHSPSNLAESTNTMMYPRLMQDLQTEKACLTV